MYKCVNFSTEVHVSYYQQKLCGYPIPRFSARGWRSTAIDDFSVDSAGKNQVSWLYDHALGFSQLPRDSIPRRAIESGFQSGTATLALTIHLSSLQAVVTTVQDDGAVDCWQPFNGRMRP